MALLKIIIILGFAHSIADLALQTEYIAKYKSANITYVWRDGKAHTVWPIVLLGHAMINGAVYYVFTGSVLIGCLETVMHFIIDYGSSNGYYGIVIDQFLHFLCIIVWAVILYWCLGYAESF